MSFDERQLQSAITSTPPDYSAGIAAYNEQVAAIGVKIKAAQAELEGINVQITQANLNLQAAYSMKIASSEQTITDLLAKISHLEDVHDQLVIAIDAKKIQQDNLSLDFSTREKQLTDSWADFHKQAQELLTQQRELEAAKITLADAVAQLVTDQTAFTNSKISQQARIDQMQAAAQEALDKGNAVMAIAQEKMDTANASIADASQKQRDLAAQIAAAQPILAQADALNAQAIKNAADAKYNSQQALQNSDDTQQIKVMRIAIENQQASLQTRINAVSLAEQKIGG